MLKIFVCEDNIVQRKKMESIIDCLKADMVDVIEKGIVTANPYEILEHIRNENNSCLYFWTLISNVIWMDLCWHIKSGKHSPDAV